MNDNEELAWVRGNRAAYASLLSTCLRELGYEDTEATRAKWIIEREAAIRALRRVCENHGDNDWDEHLHLADVIDKHLDRHLESPDDAE